LNERLNGNLLAFPAQICTRNTHPIAIPKGSYVTIDRRHHRTSFFYNLRMLLLAFKLMSLQLSLFLHTSLPSKEFSGKNLASIILIAKVFFVKYFIRGNLPQFFTAKVTVVYYTVTMSYVVTQVRIASL